MEERLVEIRVRDVVLLQPQDLLDLGADVEGQLFVRAVDVRHDRHRLKQHCDELPCLGAIPEGIGKRI